MKTLLSGLFFLFTSLLCAQELNVSVKVAAPQLTTANPQVLKSLENDLQELMNQTQWTDVEYEDFERIQASFQINILTDDSRNTFKANIQMQVTRPVYGSNYNTVLFSFIDKDVKFKYEPYQPLQKSTNNYINELSSLFSFYAYIILGMDYDSFATLEGSAHFNTAQEIVNTLPIATASAMGGWQVADRANRGRSRYWFIENLQNSRMVPYREAMYTYHRQGLDVMSVNATGAREAILEALRKIKNSNDSYFNSLLIQIFGNSKRDELIEIFKAAPANERRQVRELMREIDKANAADYDILTS